MSQVTSRSVQNTKVARQVRGRLRASKLVCRIRFGVTVPSKVISPMWDVTTIVLRDALKTFVRPKMSILEVGTGHVTVLLCWLARTHATDGLRIVGVDVNPTFLENARVVAAANHVNIELFESNLLDHVDERFDIIFGNLPYVPRAALERELAEGDLAALASVGGDDGTDVIREFLRQAPRCLTEKGQVFLGNNEFYVSREMVLPIIADAGFEMVNCVSRPRSEAKVYILTLSAPAG